MLSEITIDITITDLLAVWGAFIATLVLLWDIYKWSTSGPKIIVHTNPDMSIINVPEISEDKTFIQVDATNNGDRPTTITKLGIRIYSSWFKRVLKKPKRQAIIVNPYPGKIPHKLGPGEEWFGCIDQDGLKEEIPQSGSLVIELYTSHTKKPKKARVNLQKSEYTGIILDGKEKVK